MKFNTDLNLPIVYKKMISNWNLHDGRIIAGKLCAFLLIIFMVNLACPFYTAIPGEIRGPFSLEAVEGMLKNDNSYQEEIADLIKICGVEFKESTPEIISKLKIHGAGRSVIAAVIEVAPPIGRLDIVSEPLQNISLKINNVDYETPVTTVIAPGIIKIIFEGSNRYERYETEIEVKQGRSNPETVKIRLKSIPFSLTEIKGLLKDKASSGEIVKDIEDFGVDFKLSSDHIKILINLNASDFIINAILEVTDPGNSILIVNSEPSGKSLFVNGINHGITPAYIVDRLPEKAKIRINGGEEHEEYIEVVGISQGEINTTKIILEPHYGPAISSITLKNIKPNEVMPGKQIEVTANIVNKGSETLIYSWETKGGYLLFNNTLKPVNYWTAPFEEGNHTITISINGTSRIYDQKSETITVNKPNMNYDLGRYKELKVLRNKIGFHSNLHVLDVDFDDENNMYVLDPAGQCIRVFAPDGTYKKPLCYGRISTPKELLIKDNKIYVIHNKSDMAIERYNINGKLEESYNKRKKYKKDITTIKKPVAFAVGNQGELYVIDDYFPNIAVFEKSGRFRLRFGNSGTETLKEPIGIDVDRNGYIYVLDSKKEEVLVYNPKMQYERTIDLQSGKYTDIVIDNDKNRIFLTNTSGKNILVVDFSGKTITKFGYLENPFKIAIDKFSNIYVTNKKDSYISKFIQNTDGHRYYGKFGTKISGNIIDIAVDKNCSIFMLDKRGREIIKMSRKGWELTRFGESKKLRRPTSIAAGKGGEYIYILDNPHNDSKVLQYNNDGKFLRVIASKNDGRIIKPCDIDSDKHGNVYVLDEKIGDCLIYNHRGEFITQIETDKLVGYRPIKLAVEKQENNVYVLFRKKPFSFTPIKSKRVINIYTKEHNYVGQRYSEEVDDNTSILKVNNYGRVITAATPNQAEHEISFFYDKILDQTFYGGDYFKTAKDIEVDGVENVYILDMENNVRIYKQENLKYDYTNTLLN